MAGFTYEIVAGYDGSPGSAEVVRWAARDFAVDNHGGDSRDRGHRGGAGRPSVPARHVR